MNINYDQIDINGPAPEQEPQRQQYFIAKCRNLLQIREKSWEESSLFLTRPLDAR